jgi:hypothetical protein
MSKRYKVLQLPEKVRLELINQIVASGFAQYSQHSEWLLSKGHMVSRTTIWEFAKELQALMKKHPNASIETLVKKMALLDKGGSFR